MRPLVVLLACAALATALLAGAPSASAFGYCVDVGPVERGNMAADCGGVACVGYSGGRWQRCAGLMDPDPCELIECYCTCPPIQGMLRVGDVLA